jgi:FlaA1/EpsC-like NDP-sugar epimerase
MEHNPFEAIEVNVKGTKIVADLSIQYQVEKFVMVSTDKAVNPTNVMGASKLIAEIYIQSYDSASKEYTKFITTRFGNVLGSNGSVIPRFREQIEKGGPLTVTHPEITRYFMTIPEATQLVLEAGTMGKGGEIFVFNMGKPVKIVDLAKRMIQLSNAGQGKQIEIVFTGLRPGEKLFEELLADAETSLPTHHAKINIAKVRTHCFDEAQQAINELLEINLKQDKMKLVKKMKEIAPEFRSENSVFEILDRQDNKELLYHLEDKMLKSSMITN